MGLFITLNLVEATQVYGYYAFFYIIAVIVQQLLVMLLTSPSIINTLAFIEATIEKNQKLFKSIIEEIDELNSLRILIAERVGEQYNDTNLSIVEIIKDLFSKVREGSELLTPDEVRKLVSSLNINLEYRQANLMIRAMDVDISGKIDLIE